MVFTTTNLFKGIPCPEGVKCALTNCIFSHEALQGEPAVSDTPQASVPQRAEPESAEPAWKRRRVIYGSAGDKPPSRADLIRAQVTESRNAISQTSPQPPAVKDTSSPSAKGFSETIELNAQNRLPSLAKPVSPPPRTNRIAGTKSASFGTTSNRASSSIVVNSDNSNSSNNIANAQPAKATPSAQPPTPPVKKELLNPRLIANDPAGHQKRSLLLKHVHAEMGRLNTMVQSSALEQKHLLHLTEQELIKMALDEEEKVACDQPLVYGNVLKNRIAALKKMKIEDWAGKVKESFAHKQPQPQPTKSGKEIKTDLTPTQELEVLLRLVADQKPLAQYGYIPVPPSQEAAEEAAAAVIASRYYEICDRCSSRFQAFPERNDEGELTSNGPCRFHPNKRIIPPKSRADTGHKEPYHPCCNENIGTAGCTLQKDHVYKTSSPNRLAAVLPFTTTPENDSPARGPTSGATPGAVTFDCEMGYTSCGLELIRLTAVAWPSGEELVDALVRPLGIVIDLNSRFSGVWPEHFTTAVPYSADHASPSPRAPADSSNPDTTTTAQALPILANPQAARALLCTFLTPSTPLLGHGLENDLNVLRLCHPTIVDSILCFPHPRGLPLRFGLKMLAKRHLDRDIQTAGAQGHDSLEDARATGELIRFKVGEEWRRMRVGEGWRIEGDRLVAPSPKLRGFGPRGDRGQKRRRSGGFDGADDGDDGDGGGMSGVVAVAKM